jgi:hypothetical protein
MMTQQSCAEKAQLCEDQAIECLDPVMSADWLQMAASWREMAGDKDGPATLARLMDRNRMARQASLV